MKPVLTIEEEQSSHNEPLGEEKNLMEEVVPTNITKETEERLPKSRYEGKKSTSMVNASKKNLKPITKKPKLTSPNSQVQSVKYGLTGLRNIGNTCYMNTLIQCLRHIPTIKNFFCSGAYSEGIRNRQCLITNEFAHLIRALWNNSNPEVTPLEFYTKFTHLSPSYKSGQHQDCLEFFLALLNYLNEDCALEVALVSGATEWEKAWNQQHFRKTSYYINTFYYLNKIEYYCTQCRVSGIKFEVENVIYLVIPKKSFLLQEQVNIHLNSSDNMSCKSCKQSQPTKKSIFYHPKVLIIMLQRSMPDPKNNGHYIKNDSACTFPLKNFRFGERTYTLNAVALHIGNTQRGHYLAACCNMDYKTWYLYDDQKVSRINMLEDALKSCVYAFFYSENHSFNNNEYENNTTSTN